MESSSLIYNAIKCEACGAELQPSDLLVGVDNIGNIIRKCRYCGYEVKV